MTDEIKARIEQVNRGEVPEGYQNIFGYITPMDWNTTKFENKFKRLTRKNNENNQNVLTISAQHGLISQDDYYNHSYSSENKFNYSLLYSGDFSYNKSYSSKYLYGAIKRLDKYDKGIVSPLYICFEPKKNTISEYYIQYFEAGIFNREIYKIAQEGARNHGLLNVAYDDFFSSYLINPNNTEQQKIAEVIKQCDKVLSKKKELLEEERKLKIWLMQNLLNPDSGVRLIGFEGEWRDFNLFKNGTTYGGLSGKNAEDFGCGKPYIPYLNIFTNYVIKDKNYEYVKIQKNDKQNKVKYGDVFFTTSSETPEEVGMSAVYLGNEDELYLNSFCFGYRLHSFNILTPVFAPYYFNSKYMKKLLYKLAQGATRYNLSKTNLMKQTLLIPPTIEEQIAITDILSAQDKKISLLEQESNGWEQKKKSLMQLLLKGIVRVKV